LSYALLFAMAFSGGLHCAGMCGPFAALAGNRATGLALYLAGKTSTYVFLGAVAGALGHSLSAFGVGARALGFLTGALLLLAALHTFGLIRGSALGAPALARAARAVASLAAHGPEGKLVLGVANGLLPCPLTYAFVAMAAATASPLDGASAMAILGVVSALPLAAAAFAARSVAFFARIRLPLWNGALMLAAAALTIYRGFVATACH
jgi:sulfite exporter TauE/SafE